MKTLLAYNLSFVPVSIYVGYCSVVCCGKCIRGSVPVASLFELDPIVLFEKLIGLATPRAVRL